MPAAYARGSVQKKAHIQAPSPCAIDSRDTVSRGNTWRCWSSVVIKVTEMGGWKACPKGLGALEIMPGGFGCRSAATEAKERCSGTQWELASGRRCRGLVHGLKQSL